MSRITNFGLARFVLFFSILGGSGTSAMGGIVADPDGRGTASMVRRVSAEPAGVTHGTAVAAATMELRVTPVPARGWYVYPEGHFLGPAWLRADSGDFVSFWNVWVGKWDPEGDGPRLQSIQVKINEETFANGIGEPLQYAVAPCFVNTDCDIVFGEAGGVCQGGTCAAAFINTTRADWLFANCENSYCALPCPPTCSPPYLSWVAAEGEAIADDGSMRYVGTIVLQVPPGAKWYYWLSLDPLETFALDEGGATIPLSEVYYGTLHIPLGSCCYSLDLSTRGCADNLTKSECMAYPGSCTVWREGDSCLNPPSDEGCADCVTNADCNDNNLCTTDTCDACCQCANTPIYNPQTECCVDGACGVWPKPPSTACTTYTCGYSFGEILTDTAAPGTACDAGDPCKGNTVCNENAVCVGTENAGAECPKSRYISFVPGGAGLTTAIRVTLASLHHPEPPYPPGILRHDFSSIEGEQRWVGPLMECPDSPSQGTMMKCAKLQCEPFYFDWAAELEGRPLHITGPDIVPSSRYEIELLAPRCAGNEDLCDEVLQWPAVTTSRWGDVVAPFLQASAFDIAAVVDKVRDLPHACCKTRAQLRDEEMNPMAPASAMDIAADVDAAKGASYPHHAPPPCGP